MASDGRSPYTIDDLLKFWRSVVDSSYAQPFLDALDELGDGISIDADGDIADAFDLDQPTGGLEVFTQQMAQAKRISEAVVRTLEAMFILGWSGQVDEPAQGDARATVELTFERSARFDTLVTFPAGFVMAEEVQQDDGVDAPTERATERRYTLLTSLVFMPGEAGPKTVTAVAEKAGYGYNNPLPGTIKRLVQVGANLSNSGGTVAVGATTHDLRVDTTPDAITPQNVGQYIEFVGGANVGRVIRMVGYRAPDTTVPHGGVAVLARTALLRASGLAGAPVVGETFEQATTGATGRFVAVSGDLVVLESADSLWAATFAATGIESGASFTVDKVEQASSLIAESASAVWRVLDWEADLNFTVTNAASPTGGRAGMLDELGRERRIRRAPGESDDAYRKRIHQLPDTISPNAVRRAANRILAPLGQSVCLRETGTEKLPGFYADVDAVDYDFVTNPDDKWKVALDYTEFRAFFLIGVPSLNLGEFGLFFDDGPFGFYDASPYYAFYDGFALDAAIIYINIWHAVNKARAGGVGFELVIDACD